MKKDKTQKPNNKGRRHFTKRKPELETIDQNRDLDNYNAKEGKPNDLSWYVVDEQILNDAARVPYSIPVGMPFSRNGSFAPTGVTLPQYDDAIPGVLVANVVPCLGNANYASDPINVAANSVYQFVRSKISGSRPYNAVDMMVYLGAMDSVYCYVTWLTRLYSTVYTYHQSNRYMSRALVEAQGVDYDNLLANLAQFRASLNLKIAKVRALYLPSILPLFRRHSWLFSQYYVEGESEKDQIYLYSIGGLHLFGYDSDGAGMLHGKRLYTGTPLTTTDLLNMLDSMIDPIYADEDFNRISGDFLKAYEGKVFTLEEVPDITTIKLMWNEEVLLQFKNAKFKTILPDANDQTEWFGDFFDYHQDTTKTYLQLTKGMGGLMCHRSMLAATNPLITVDASSPAHVKGIFASAMYDWSKDTLLTSPHHDVTPGETMINTRLTLAMEFVSSSSFWGGDINDIYFGSEWPLNFRIYVYHRNKGTGVVSLFSRIYERTLSYDYTDQGASQQLAESQWPILSSFKYLPEMSVIVQDPNTAVVYNSGRSIFEVDNYALANANTISGLHNAAILGEYNVPNLSVGR